MLPRWRDVSPRQRLAGAGLGLIVVGVSGYVFVLSPAYARKAALETRLDVLQRELHEASAQVGALTRYRQEKAEHERRLGLMVERLSPTRAIPPLYQTLQEVAAQTGLTLALFRPREPRVENYYTEIPIAVTAQGTYHRLGRFLARIAELPRIVLIEELRISAIEHPQVSLRADMTLTAYIYRPVGARELAQPDAPADAPKRGTGPSR
jgi:type IV pilus assembly protein PilO